MHVAPLLLIIVLALLFGLVAVGFLRLRRHEADQAVQEASDELLAGLVMLTSSALGVSVTYVLIDFAR
jgi:hypothetical protein